MKIQLTPSEVRRYQKPVAGKGGFQTLLSKLAKSVDAAGVLDVSQDDLEKLLRHSFAYGQGGFQERTKPTARRVTRSGATGASVEALVRIEKATKDFRPT